MARRKLPPCPFDKKDYDVRLSFTKAIQVRNCPYFGYQMPVDKDGETEDIGLADVSVYSGPNAERGRFVHDVFSRYTKWCRQNRVTSDFNHLREIFAEAVIELAPSYDITESIAEITASFGSDHEFPPLPKGALWGSEEPIWWMISDKDLGVRVAVLSVLDDYTVIDDVANLVDYKSGYRLPNRKALPRDLQLPTYALALVNKIKGLKQVKAKLDFPAINGKMDWGKDGLVTTDDCIRARKLLLETGAMMKHAFGELKKGAKPWQAFDPRPGKPCQPYEGVICGKILTCPYVKKLSPDAIVRDDQQARQIFADVLWLTASASAKKAAVFGYIGGTKEVSANGKSAKMVARPKYNYDPKAVIEWLQARGTPLEMALDLNMKALKGKPLLSDMLAAGVVKASQEWEPDIVNAEEPEK